MRAVVLAEVINLNGMERLSEGQILWGCVGCCPKEVVHWMIQKSVAITESLGFLESWRRKEVSCHSVCFFCFRQQMQTQATEENGQVKVSMMGISILCKNSKSAEMKSSWG